MDGANLQTPQKAREGIVMDYKAVLQEQISELQKLQVLNIESSVSLSIKIGNAVAIIEQILKIYVEVKGPMD